MHMVEALLGAGDATGDPVWHERAQRIAQRLIDRVACDHGWRVVEHFDASWRPLPEYNADDPRHPFRPYGVTPGHGLEWSRLLLQIAPGLRAIPAGRKSVVAFIVDDERREVLVLAVTTGGADEMGRVGQRPIP